MARGEYKIAEQIGLKGYFGYVVLETEPIESDGAVTIDFDQSLANRWQSGAQFGIDFVLENIATRKFFPAGGRIHVHCIGGMEVDTTNMLIAYVAAEALCLALGIQPTKRPNWDRVNGTFNFPK